MLSWRLTGLWASSWLATLLSSQPATAAALIPGHHNGAPEWVFGGPSPNEREQSSGGKLGAVASESKECTAIGHDILKLGGNAIDAMVGTTFCVGTMAMYHSGIGGGGFVVIRDENGTYEHVDFRETAPGAAFEDMFQGNVNGSIYGGLSVAVPGEVRGLEYIHRKYGKLRWQDIIAGAINIARYGFRVSKDLVHFMDKAVQERGYNFLLEEPEWAEDFAPNGKLVKEGDIMTRKRYAKQLYPRTLQTIAEQGASAFYNGPMAKSMVETARKSNGTVTTEDFRWYRPVSRPALNITYRGLTVFGAGAPAGGAVCLNILRTMEQYPAHEWLLQGHLTVHRFTEAMRFAYGARADLGDPAFVKNMEPLEARMLSHDTAVDTSRRISDNHTLPVDRYMSHHRFAPDSHGTSHVVTADQSGMAASLTTTINLLFGAQIMDPKTGIILNNEMNDFSIPHVRNEFGFEPTEANFIRPFKRPLSSITPLIAANPDGSLATVIGAAGGSRIISSTAQTFWHSVEHGLSLAEALHEPRLHDQLMPNYVMVEYTFDNSTVDSLRERGHNITRVGDGLSAVQAIKRHENGTFEAASEPRQKNSGAMTV